MAVIRVNEIIDRMLSYHPGADIALVQKAYVWSAKLHSGTLRKSGQPYLSHPLEVAGILTELKLREASIAAGLLHDVVEDTIITQEELETEFGKEIGRLVDGVTKIGKITQGATKIEVQAENFRKIILAMSQDVRVILIKLADRLHNMRTLEFLGEDKRRNIARETLDIYAPVAGRLGIHWIQAQLEDLCLQHLKPEVYFRLAAQVAKIQEARQEYVDQVQKILTRRLAEAGIEASVSGRFKHLFSINKKMEKQKLTFDEVHDLIAFRIIVGNINECYDALRIIHSIWTPVPGRIKDYIALPKLNMYRSLHTTVIGPEGERVEVQIRTAEMHAIAEHGIAAHWRYKESGGEKPRPEGAQEKKTLEFLSHLVEYHEELKDPYHFLESVKSEVVPDEIVVFTPAGDFVELPSGATPVDMAYAIHSELGNRCGGAKVNNRIVPLHHELKSGDTVEIISSKTVEPAKAWLDIVKSPRARTHINHWLSTREAERVRELGRQLLETELLKYDRHLGDILKKGEFEPVVKRFSFHSQNRLFEALGFGNFPLKKVVSQLVDPEELRGKGSTRSKAKKAARKTAKSGAKKTAKKAGAKKAGARKAGARKTGAAKRKTAKEGSALVVRSHCDSLLPLASCCNPIVGDDIVAVRADDKSMEVHRLGCHRVSEAHGDRIIPADWSDEIGEFSEAAIEIVSEDKKGMLMAITSAISNANVDVLRALAHTTEQKKALHTFHIQVKNRRQLRQIVKSLEKIDGVISVERL